MTQPIRPKTRLILATVVSITQISPNFRRVRLAADFTDFPGTGHDDDQRRSLHFRFLFGPKDSPWPEQTDEGLDFPNGADEWHRPAYTVCARCPEGRWIDTDVFIHDGGRVTEWTGTAQVGDTVGLTGPGGGGVITTDWIALLGDETAMPIIVRMLNGLSRDAKGHAIIRVPHADDIQPLDAPPAVQVEWAISQNDDELLKRLATLNLPPKDAGERFVFFASEKAQTDMARDILNTLGLERGESRAAAYWHAHL